MKTLGITTEQFEDIRYIGNILLVQATKEKCVTSYETIMREHMEAVREIERRNEVIL